MCGKKVKNILAIITIFAFLATMWHETKEELIGFLKSILRLDEDQCARRMAMKYIQLNKDEIDSEYYDLEGEKFQPKVH